jgi:alanine racemase
MQRLGFEPEEAKKIAQEIKSENFLRLEGVCTHFASSDDFQEKDGATSQQIKLFQKIIADIKTSIQDPILFHYLNSAAILTGLEPQLDLARPGIALYGSLPKLQGSPKAEVKPVMSVKSFIGFIHRVNKGEKVSYGGTWQAEKNSVIAVVPMGYADGMPRALGNKGHVLIRGELCPVVGIICMDYFMVDVTNLSSKNVGPSLGDEVVVLGKQKNKIITAHEMALKAQTISYEILTGMQGRLPRIYIH